MHALAKVAHSHYITHKHVVPARLLFGAHLRVPFQRAYSVCPSLSRGIVPTMRVAAECALLRGGNATYYSAANAHMPIDSDGHTLYARFSKRT